MNKLYRFPKRGYIGGVCAGLGKHTGIDPVLWRVVAFFGGFLFIYIILWIVLKKGE